MDIAPISLGSLHSQAMAPELIANCLGGF
jgi:hypothetical protein